MMKKYLLSLVVLGYGINAYGAGVVLSDTSIQNDDNSIGEESFVAPQSESNYTNSSSQSNSYMSQQIQPAFVDLLANDTSDPLFLTPDNKFLSDTYISLYDRKIRIGQYLDYGINNNLVLHANILYQLDTSGRDENGFSSTEIGGVYRMNHGKGSSRIISDALFGLKLWGSSHVRTPEYADSSYYAGLRFGRQYTGVTLAGTVKSTWIFDNERGLSYIDFIPEAYFRFKYDWRGGIGLDFRKSTNTHLLDNQEWLNLKLLKQFGNTQWVCRFDYEFESSEIQIGGNIKILF